MISSRKNPSLADVARLAGVSAVTVSRAIRTPEVVSARRRERVAAAIAELNYSPDPAASALASNVTTNIGLLLPSLTNSVFGDVLRGIYEGVEGTRFFVQIGNFRYSALKEEALIRTFLRQKPAGLIVTGFEQTEEATKMLEHAPCPVVQIMDVRTDPVDMAVGFDQRAAGYAVAQHFQDCGYLRPGSIGARLDQRSQRRLAGFRDACSAAGIYNELRSVTSPKPSSVGLGRHLFELLMSRAPDTDAVFCNNDDLGIGALMEARRRGFTVPDDLGLCSFHDMEMARHMYPALTAVATPRHEIGARAITMILDEIEQRGSVTNRAINTGFQLVQRETTRRISV